MDYIDGTTKCNKILKNILNRKYIKNELKESNYILSNINGYSLDLEQRKAIITDECANLIVAGAGSGKSLTMVGKIRYLVERKKIKPSDILCISFTKDAAISLENSIKKSYNYNVKVYTFHKLSLEILKSKEYKIVDNYLLNYIIEEYFECIIFNNKEMIYRLKKILNKVDTPYKIILKSKEILNLKRTIYTFINLFKTNNYSLDYILSIKNNKNLISIIIDIYYIYQTELKSTNTIDFNDMIVFATNYVRENGIYKYRYIIVDEYQDTSFIRCMLIKEIINKTFAKLVCVGDDYQSIYRFNGCDVSLFLNFNRYFKYSKVLKITNTYRNSQQLINVAGSFIMKNKYQLKKKLKSNKSNSKPIKIMYGNNLKKLIDVVLSDGYNIIILGRNNFDINKYFKLNKDGYLKYREHLIKYLTIHSSKGLEFDDVIIINLIDDILGLPNKIIDNNIFKYVNKYSNLYPFDEERRLFYVALTRTKNNVYLLVDKRNCSIFIKELIKDYNKYIEYI